MTSSWTRQKNGKLPAEIHIRDFSKYKEKTSKIFSSYKNPLPVEDGRKLKVCFQKSL